MQRLNKLLAKATYSPQDKEDIKALLQKHDVENEEKRPFFIQQVRGKLYSQKQGTPVGRDEYLADHDSSAPSCRLFERSDSRLIYQLEREGKSVKLTVIHEMEKEGSKFIEAVSTGWKK